MSQKHKYDRDERKHIAGLIENLKNKEDYIAIFEILMDDKANSYTQNSKGVFLNLSSVSNRTMRKIDRYLKKINKEKTNEIDLDVNVIPDQKITKSNRTYKLSNYEKNILKQRKLKKVLDDDSEYQVLKFSAVKKM